MMFIAVGSQNIPGRRAPRSEISDTAHYTPAAAIAQAGKPGRQPAQTVRRKISSLAAAPPSKVKPDSFENS